MTDPDADDLRPRRVEPIYFPDRSGDVRLYSGDLDVLVDGEVETIQGELTLRA